MIETIQAGKWNLTVEKVGNRNTTRYVIRLANGMAISLGATKKYRDIIIQKVTDGLMDTYINDHCKGGQ
jgi:hypothetical protein